MTPPDHRSAPLTRLVGREREIGEVIRILGSGRLLTLTGPGGIGKTRLARAVVDRVREKFAGDAWVGLGSLSQPELVPREMAATLGVIDPAGGPLPEPLLRKLRAGPFLLVLDDCEHLVEAVAEMAEDLLQECPDLVVLATSREALGVPGERAWLVPPLSLPDGAPSSVEDLLEFEGPRLFLERARDALPTFEVDDGNREAVDQICRRLDGIPLAIELAAARVRVLPPAQIAARLDDAFRLLTGGRRTDLPRHRTLRAAVDWSHELLSPPERRLLQRLSVFRGGCTLDAVEAVCSDDEPPAHEILEPLAGLVDRSMLRMRERGGAARYSLLETIRLYAAERLEESGGTAVEEVRSRHARHFLSLAENVAPRLERLVHSPEILAEFEIEHDNFRAGLAWAQTGEPGVALRMAGALAWFWITAGHWREGERRLGAALGAGDDIGSPEARARALSGAGAIAYLLHDLPAARERYGEATALWRSLDRPQETARSLAVLAQAQAESGNEEGARASIEEALELARAGEAGWLLAWVLACRGAVCRSLGRLEEADSAYGEAQAAAGRAESPSLWILEAPLGRALVALLEDEPARAAVHARAAVRAARAMDRGWFAARALLAASAVTARGGDSGAAAVLLGALSRRRAHDRPFLAHEERLYDQISASLRAALGEGPLEEAAARGTELDTGQALARAEEDLDRLLSREPLTVGEGSAGRELPGGPASPPGAADTGSRGGPTLHVLALGPLEIYRDGLPLPAETWRYAKPRELFLFLLLHPRGATREQVGLAFWPDASTAQVKNNFHVALHRLRRVLGDPRWIVLEQERYRLHPDLEIDLDASRFEEGVAGALRAMERAEDDPTVLARLRGALSLYRGEFLESEGAGDWHLETRDSLRHLFVRGEKALADACLAHGRLEEAASAYRAVIAVDDLREDAYRGLMVSRARLGDRTGALRLFQRLESILAEELDAEPEAETLELADRLRRNLPV